MSDKYDVIVIGAGIGGLTAAAILARNGKKVLVLEKNPVVGGYAVCFKRKGFIFDASLHMMQGCNRDGITYNILKKCGIINKLRFVKPKFLYCAYFPGLEIKVKQAEPTFYIETLKKRFHKEAGGIDALVKECKKILVSFEEFQKNRKITRELKFYLDKTCLDIFYKFTKDPKLISVLSQLWGYFGLPPSKLSAYYLPFFLYDYVYNGGYYPLGGSYEISKSLKDAICINKGKVVLNTRVEKILVRDGQATGVISGENCFYSDSVISNVDARYTFKTLIGDKYLPNYFTENLYAMEPSISAFQVYLGLDIDISKFGFRDYEFFINPSYDLDSHYEMFMKNDINKAPFAITIYTNLSRTKNNKTCITLTTLSGYDFWHRFSVENYKKVKEDLSSILIKRAEDFVPNLASYIKTIEIATPLTMERYTGNYKGAIYGWAHNVFQSGIRRFFTTTPIKNLHLASAWTYPGGGISGVMHAGELAAEYILRGKFYP